MNDAKIASGDDHSAIGPAGECCNSAFDPLGCAKIDWCQFYSERRRGRLDGPQLPSPGGHAGVPQDRHSFQAWFDLFEKLKPFATEAVLEIRKARGIAPGSGQALYEA